VRIFARDHPEVQLIHFEHNRGRGAARQAGLEAARGEYVAFVDADIVLPEHWLRRCLDSIADADAVGGVAVPDGDVTYLYRTFGLEPKVVSATTTITGNNGLYRRGIFRHSGFDPQLREGEDVALNQTLRTAGARMLTVDDLHVRHEESKGFRQSVVWLYQSGQGASRQLLRYRQLRVPDLTFAGWLAVWAAALVMGRSSRLIRALPAVYLLLAAGAHTGRSFVWRREHSHRLLAATLVDGVFLTAYFAGRLRGLLDADAGRGDRPE
jgi:glycosyltransferase involved in cell wall biosynthesis